MIFGKKKKEIPFLYELKESLVTDTEMEYLECIENILPEGYLVLPQANLAAFITRTDQARYRGELFRNIDFIVTDLDYCPVFLIEINDQTHLAQDRRERDRKVADICEEAGIPLITFWTSYGVQPDYIERRIMETLASLPAERIHHFFPEKKRRGCYIATAVYGSYDCPQVWVLRRFRDQILAKHAWGRGFIRFYYAVSSGMSVYFGRNRLLRKNGRRFLDGLVRHLEKRGLENTPYRDEEEAGV